MTTDDGLSLVAQDAGEVVGHLMFTRSLLDAPTRLVEVQVLILVAVLPERQRQGTGSALIRGACRSWPSGRCRSSSSRETGLHDRAWVSREAVIADNGVVLIGELDDDDLTLCVAKATNAARASGPAPAEVFSDWGPGYARLFGGVSYTYLDMVGS